MPSFLLPYQMGETWLKLDDLNKAYRYFKKVFEKGENLRAEGKNGQAIKKYHLALDINPLISAFEKQGLWQ